MDMNDLNDRIAKKEAQISKIEAKIAKWEGRKTLEYFIKKHSQWYTSDKKLTKSIDTLEKLAELRLRIVAPIGGTIETCLQSVEGHYRDYIDECDDEIENAKRDLEVAKEQLAKYDSQVKMKNELDSKEKIKVIVDFLNNWEEGAINYIKDNVQYLKKYFEVNSARINYINNNRFKIGSSSLSREEYDKTVKDFREKERSLYSQVNPLTKTCYSNAKGLDLVKLKEILDADKEKKYWKFVKQVEDVVGSIIDVSHLRVGEKGDLNGYVIGSSGKASVQTIGAGGYNQGIIVNVKHGQMFHFRTIVKKIK